VGIDDWSWRHSSRYGTIMVDLERHSVVDVLEDRSVESTKAWLQERPTIEIVSRDRCGLYAQAAREGAPQARQVADRFHLVQNLREAINEQISVYGHAHIRPILSEDAIASARSQQRRARLAHRQSRQEIFDRLQALRQQGLTYSEIARRTGYERRSIANWLTSNAPRDRNRASLNPTLPLYFEAFLAEYWKNGNRVGRHLFYDIKNRGYTGSRSNLERLLKVWREAENIQLDEPPPDMDVSEPVRDPETGHMISSVVAAALCIKPRGLLTDRQAGKVDALKQARRYLPQCVAWPCASTASCAAGTQRHWTNGSTMPSTPSSRRSCVSQAFCAGTLTPSKMQSNPGGVTVKPKGRSIGSRC
jgi:hypothetical protein